MSQEEEDSTVLKTMLIIIKIFLRPGVPEAPSPRGQKSPRLNRTKKSQQDPHSTLMKTMPQAAGKNPFNDGAGTEITLRLDNFLSF